MISTPAIHIQSYLADRYPEVAQEVALRFTSKKCNDRLVGRVCYLAMQATSENWEHQIVSIASVLLLCSPETIYVGCAVRRNSGATGLLAKKLGVSQPAISQKVDRARHYYTHVSWCREAVDNIVKEVRDE